MKIVLNASALVGLLLLATPNLVKAQKETFFGCERGYQFETKKKAARCIKQQKLTFRPPLKCNHKKANRLNWRLVVDSDGVRDLCEVVGSDKDTAARKSIPRSKRDSLKVAPQCMVGYQLKARRGKDACAKGNAEQIKPPSNKVSL